MRCVCCILELSPGNIPDCCKKVVRVCTVTKAQTLNLGSPIARLSEVSGFHKVNLDLSLLEIRLILE